MKLIRDYVKSHMPSVFSGCKESDDAFTMNHVAASAQPTTYLLEFGAFDPVEYASGQYITDEVQVVLSIETPLKKVKPSDFDDAQKRARKIRSALANVKNIRDLPIQRVVPGAIEITPLESNNETIKTTINFTFEVSSQENV